MPSSPDATDCDLLLDRVASNAKKQPSKFAVSFISNGPNGGKLGKQLTYAELEEETNILARRLLNSGLAKGDRAVLVYPPSLDFMIAFLACLKAGITAVPVFPPHPARRDTLNMFSNIVAGCGAKFALTNSEYNHLKKISGIRDAVSKLKRPPTAAWPDSLKWIVTDSASSKGDRKRMAGNTTIAASQVRSDVAFLQYTSGSTSEPKGVMITHGNLAHNLTIITNDLEAGDDTVVVSWLPQYHDMGLIGSYLGILYCGGTGYYMSPLSFLQRPMLWLEAVSKYKATHLQAPNFAFKLTARKFQPSDYTKEGSSLDLSSVGHVINAAEPVDQDSIDTFYNTFSPFGFKEVIYPTYGLAEHTVFVCSGGKQRLRVLKKELEVDGRVVLVEKNEEGGSNNNRDATSNLVGCGFPSNQRVDVQIVNTETFTSLGEDAVGEIWVNSPSKAAGYYQKEKETKEDFHATLQRSPENNDDNGNDDGYLRTGDLGFLHGGELFICGRLKDLIIVAGRNYYPQDIEATAEATSDAVRPGCSAAFTIDPTREGGEEVALVMELKEVPSASDVKSVCLPLANQIRGAINQEHSLGITEIAFLRAKKAPKTSSGKIARAWCRKGFVGGSLDIVYRLSFKSETGPLEIESNNNGPGPRPSKGVSRKEAAKMSKTEILARLTADVSRIGSIPLESVSKDAALVTMLDSLTLSQLKGLLENGYAVKLSDEYLFRESTTLTKLVEVIKLGYAPDDGDGGRPATSGSQPPGTSTGLAGALGCPPGVVCSIL